MQVWTDVRVSVSLTLTLGQINDDRVLNFGLILTKPIVRIEIKHTNHMNYFCYFGALQIITMDGKKLHTIFEICLITAYSLGIFNSFLQTKII